MKEHKEVDATFYCPQCKINLCSKCEIIHSKLLQYHNKNNLDKDISETFNGYCNEENHLDKYEYFCKTHNKLCCCACISKIKRKGKGQHKDCDVCIIEDIKEDKKNKLSENLLHLDNLSKNIEKSINELKSLFEKINENKEELKINIQKIFSKIRNALNGREDEILFQIEEMYEKEFYNENTILELDKLPKKIKISLDKGKLVSKEWNDDNKLSQLINDCINIEKNIISINQINENIKKCKDKHNIKINFIPEKQNDINRYLSKIKKFGYLNKEIISDENNEKTDDIVIDLDIRTVHEEPKGLSIELHGYSDKKYNKYYPNIIEYEEDDIVSSICLEGKDEKSLDIMMEIIKNSNLDKLVEILKMNYVMKKENDKLYLIFKLKINSYDFIKKIFELDINPTDFDEILFMLKSNFDFGKFLDMNDEEIFLNLFSFILSVKGKSKNIILILSKLKKFIPYQLINLISIFKNADVKLDYLPSNLINFLKRKDVFKDEKEEMGEKQEKDEMVKMDDDDFEPKIGIDEKMGEGIELKDKDENIIKNEDKIEVKEEKPRVLEVMEEKPSLEVMEEKPSLEVMEEKPRVLEVKEEKPRVFEVMEKKPSLEVMEEKPKVLEVMEEKPAKKKGKSKKRKKLNKVEKPVENNELKVENEKKEESGDNSLGINKEKNEIKDASLFSGSCFMSEESDDNSHSLRINEEKNELEVDNKIKKENVDEPLKIDEEKNESDQIIEEKIKDGEEKKHDIKKEINKLKNFIEKTFKDIFRYMKLDKFLVTILIMKYKSGFILDINSSGLTKVFNDLYYSKVKEDEKE